MGKIIIEKILKELKVEIVRDEIFRAIPDETNTFANIQAYPIKLCMGR